jgi:hypothetical protein
MSSILRWKKILFIFWYKCDSQRNWDVVIIALSMANEAARKLSLSLHSDVNVLVIGVLIPPLLWLYGSNEAGAWLSLIFVITGRDLENFVCILIVQRIVD